MYYDRWQEHESLEQDRLDRLQEERKKKEFEAAHCMYSDGESNGPPGCCLSLKLFGRACEEHISFSLEEVHAIGVRLLGLSGMRRKAALELTDTVIEAVLHEGK